MNTINKGPFLKVLSRESQTALSSNLWGSKLAYELASFVEPQNENFQKSLLLKLSLG